ncbi:MAG TPA: acyltransferase [Streptomyces sp.]
MAERDGQAARESWRWARMGAAITAGTTDAAGFAGFGEGSYLAFPQGVLENPGRTAIGAGCVVNEHGTLSAGLPGDTSVGAPLIRLGDRCVLGRGTEILAVEHVELGEDVWTASRVTIVDHDHRHDQPGVPVALQWPLAAAPVVIGAGSVLSTGVTGLAGARIGAGSIVASGAQVLAGDYPARAVLAGVPARVVRVHAGELDVEHDEQER